MVHVPDAPSLSGLHVRPLQASSDYRERLGFRELKQSMVYRAPLEELAG